MTVKRNIDWNSVNWSLTNAEIASHLQCSGASVYSARKRLELYGAEILRQPDRGWVVVDEPFDYEALAMMERKLLTTCRNSTVGSVKDEILRLMAHAKENHHCPGFISCGLFQVKDGKLHLRSREHYLYEKLRAEK